MNITWTQEAIEGLGVRTDLKTALGIFGMGTTAGYKAAKRGDLPFPVLTIGRKYVVPVAGLLKALGIDADDKIPAA
ncbi:DNA-binding protein [Rhodococcus pseudokoreensis]|uniref:DNA-binding protein n=2 Tax=Rhodococcus pseudokoreensis TaxID=2811421 RepID=A0A974WDB1_9NOCA|nr:DNA-binding protein [Rhodococcus pseudokoreensis]